MRSVILSAGRSCFTVCPGCYNHFSRTASETAQILAFVARSRTSFGLRKITVGGGDPLTRPDIVPLLAGLRAQGLKIHLDTVGTAFLGSTQIRFMGSGTVAHVSAADVAPLMDLIGIPLDGSTDTVQQRFRRHITVASQQAVLTCLDEAGAHVCVNTVVHAGNADDMANIAGRLHDHPGVREWQLFQFMPIGPLGHRNRDRYLVSDGDFHRAADTARTHAPRGITVTVKSARQRQALAGLLRVVKPGGVVIGSVMSLWGSLRARLPGALQLAFRHGTEVTDAVVRTGDLRHVPAILHVCRMFTWEQLIALIAECGGEVLAGSASNWASVQDPRLLEDIERTPRLWERFLDYETAACASPGARDGGTHVLFAVRPGDRPGGRPLAP